MFKVTAIEGVADDDPRPFADSTDRRVTLITGTGGKYSDRRLVITPVSGEKIENLVLDVYRNTTPELAEKAGASMR